MIALILGTRPEIVKLSPIIRRLHRTKSPFALVHTGQHYSYNMDAQFFEELELPVPQHRFARPESLGPNRHDELVDWMRDSIEKTLKSMSPRPSAVLVQGDTDSVLAGARAASNVGKITIGHVEAGLRSFDLKMPEERNRIEADRLSDILFAPTESARQNLLRENLGAKRIEVTGNTIVDALLENMEIVERKKPKAALPQKYALLTLHRPESVDDRERLQNVIRSLEKLVRKKVFDRIIFPAHPRTVRRLNEFGMDPKDLAGKGFSMPEPMGFLDFIRHEKNAALIFTDSGGVQEEACILKVPCVTIRTTTERPETVDSGANMLAGYDPDRIVSCALEMKDRSRNWANPFGDGRASERIVAALEKKAAAV